MSATLPWSAIALRLGLTLAAAFLIGLNRGEHAHPAGLRTTLLIGTAAALAMIEANWLVIHTPDTHNNIIGLDMMRLPLGILDGVGFIGAGAILRRGEMVRGLTSAATIWVMTVIGLCFGGGQLELGGAGTVVAVVALWLMTYVEAALIDGRRGRLTVTFAGGGTHDQTLIALLRARGFKPRSRRVERAVDGVTCVECSGRYRGPYPDWSSALVQEVMARAEVKQVVWSDLD